jgi:hypothetical protein
MATASFAWRADVHVVTNPEHRFFARSILAMVIVSEAHQRNSRGHYGASKTRLDVKTGRPINVGSFSKAGINFST